MIRHLLILAALLCGSAAHAADQATPPMSFVAGKLQQTSPLNVRSLSVGCAYSQNDTATLRAALESGGVAAGKTLFIPSGCKILLGSPGSGDSVADLATNTTIQCEDQTAGFVLARKSCSSGSDTPGAACTADNQCHNGTCDADYPAGTAFAPTEGSTYTVFAAAANSSGVGVKGCSIWTNGASGAPQAIGGSGKLWGYCDGAGGSDVTGEGCAVTCDVASGILYGAACTSSATCGGGTCTDSAGTCKTGGGACASVPYATNFAPAGPGKINVIDFSAATGAVVEGVTIYDHRRGDQTVKVGTRGVVTDLTADARSLTVPPVDTWVPYGINASVTNGLFLGTYTNALRAGASGWDAGIVAAGYNSITDCRGGSLGDASQTGWNGSTNLVIQSAGVIAKGFNGGGGLHCIRPSYGGGYNFLVSQAYCDGNLGAKFIVQGPGNQYMGVRGAWSGRGAVVGLGDQRGRCTGGTGTRTGKVCVFGAGDDATIGCPTGGTCAAHDDFPASGAAHFIIGGGSLLHTDQTGVDFIRTPDSKRCTTGTDAGGPCTTDADCATGACRPLMFTEGSIRDVKFYGGQAGGNTAINLNTSAVAVNPNSINNGGGPSIENWTVDLDLSGGASVGFGAGIKFPSLARYCVGGSAAAYTSCTADATCTGGGKCEAPVKNFVASGNVAGATTPFTNWDEAYGDVSGVSGIQAADTQGKDLSLTAGEALTKGQTVTISTAASNTVLKALTSNPEKVVGVVMADTLNGAIAKVRTQGIGYCIAHAAAGVTRGDLLKPSTTTAGTVGTGTTSDPLIGVAIETASANGTFRCLVGAIAGIQSNATVFPKFADDGFTTTSSGYAACSGTPTQLGIITHTATSGRTIRLQGIVAHDVTGAVTRVATLSIRRGGSSCSAGSPTTLVSSDTEMKSNENITAAIGVKDTGQSGSVTYRLCACADTGSSIEADNGLFSLTEY